MCCPWYSRSLIPVHIFNLIALLLHVAAFLLPAISVIDDEWTGILFKCKAFDTNLIDNCYARDITEEFDNYEDWEKASVLLAIIGVVMYVVMFITLVSTCCRCGHNMCTVVLAILFCVITIGCSVYPAVSYWLVDGFSSSYSLALFVAAGAVQLLTLLLLFVSGCVLKAEH